MPAIEARGVWFSYSSGAHVLRGASLKASGGEAVAVVGPTGSGKTTLLLILAGLLAPERGEVLLDGAPLSSQLPGARRRIGVLFQNPEDQLFNATVYDEIAYALRRLGLSERAVEARVHDVASRLGVQGLLDRPPFRLSAGQKKLVALASILVYDPDILILDEPTANLDGQGFSLVTRVILESLGQGKVVVFSTHDIDSIVAMASRVCAFTKPGIMECMDAYKAVSTGLPEKAGLPTPLTLKALDILLGGRGESARILWKLRKTAWR